jgi:predicted amidohydrolase YtcJ
MKIQYPATVIALFILFSMHQSCKPMKYADTIFINGKIITVSKDFAICEGVAISGDKIMAVGTSNEIRKLSGPGTTSIDLHGRTIIPGLIDAHLHPESASLSELEEEIPDVHNISQLLTWIKSEAGKKKNGEWIIHPKFFPTRLNEMRQPTLTELDSVAPDNPVFLNGSFGGMINSEAMAVSGITGKTDSPGIIKDNNTGLPTGFIRSSAFSTLKITKEKSLSAEEKENALVSMLRRYNQYGLTSLFSGAGNPETMEIYRDMANKKILSVRICQIILLPSLKKITKESVDSTLKLYRTVTGSGDEWVRTGSLKVFLDGGILTGTAYMKEPWGIRTMKMFGIEDHDYHGVVNFSREELLTLISEANANNWSFTAHATGEAAVDLLLDVYGEVDRQKSIRDRRFSIIHGNFFSDEAISKMAEMNVYANLQPAWFYKDAGAMESVLGSGKIKIFHPYRHMTDAGVMINGGSDHMVKWDANSSINPYNPFLAMYAMVTRKTERGSMILPEQALSREEAIKAYTINNAYASFEESIKGSIEPGKLADLVVLSDDILTCNEDSIKDIRSLMTILGGKTVYGSAEDLH